MGVNFIKNIKLWLLPKIVNFHLNKDWKRKSWIFALKFWVENFESKIWVFIDFSGTYEENINCIAKIAKASLYKSK